MAAGDPPPTGLGAAGTPINGPVRTSNYGSPSPVGSNKFDVDYTPLTGLRTEVQGLVKDLAAVDKAVKDLASTIKSAAPTLGMIGGGTNPAPRGGAGLTVAGFGAAGGPPGATTTAAGFSGAVSKGMAYAAAGLTVATVGGVAASAAGAVNSYMNQIGGAGQASNFLSTQQNAIFGQSTAQTGAGGVTGTSQGWSKLSNLSQSDLAGAQSLLSSNWFLKGGMGSQKMKNSISFMNAAQSMAPGMGATQAAQFGATLTSAGALRASNMFLGGNRGILLNPNGTVNSGQQTFKNLFQVITRNTLGPNPTAAQLKNFAQNDAAWAGIAQNFGQGTAMNLTDQDLTMLQQWAAAGGSTTAAAAAVSGTVAATGLNKTTQHTRLDQSNYQGSVQGRNWVNTKAAHAYGAAANYSNAHPAVANDAYLASTGTHAVLSFVDAISKATGGVLDLVGALDIIKGLRSRLGGAGGGGGAAAAGEEGSVFAGSAGGAAADVAAGGSAAVTAAGGGVAAVLAAPATVAGAGLLLGWYLSKDKSPLPKSWKGHGSPILSTTRGGSDTNVEPKGGWASEYVGDPPTGSTTTQGMTPTMAKRVAAMQQANPNIQISSGHRTASQQAYLYKAKGGVGVAPPGQSAHQKGMAADLGPPSQFGWIARNASKFGLGRPAPMSEPWHVQAMGDPAPAGNSVTGSQVVSTAATQYGVNYVWGGETPGKGFDCSGLVQWVFAKLGISLPRTTFQQVKMGTAVNGIGNAQPGDLLFYAGSDGTAANPGHVTIYAGGGKQIEAPYTGKQVVLDSVGSSGAGGVVAIRRVIGGGAGASGQSAVQAAQSAVGSPSTDASNHSGNNGAMGGAFLSTINSTWLNSGMGAYEGSGGSGSSGSTGAAASTSGTPTSSSGSATPGNLSTTPSGAGYLSPAAVYQLAIGAGLSPKNAQIATAVAKVESRFLPTAVDHDSNGTTDYGLWQINSVHGVGSNMFVPTNAAAEMAKLTNNGASWGPWAPDFGSSTYGGNPPMGGKVQAAMQSLGFMGDPTSGGSGGMGGFSASPVTLRGAKVPGMMSGGMGGGNVTINAPITVQSASAQEAQRFVQMIMQELKNLAGIDAMAGN